ncbi:MAG: GerMN domain-containing protein [Methanoregulaceae archaeon]|nr:GerMN domain-containing protein [Methanoregulaceae archaeon]
MSNPKGPTTKTLLIVALCGAAIVGSLAAYVKLTPADRVPEDQRRVEAPAKPRIEPQIDVSVEKAPEGRVYVFEPFFDGNDLKFNTRMVDVPKGTSPETYALGAFLEASRIPAPEARVLGVDVRNGLAAVSFNSAFAGGYGSSDEQVLIEGIRRSLGQFPAINELELYIDGTKMETLGSVELSEPLPVIRPTTNVEAPKSPDTN